MKYLVIAVAALALASCSKQEKAPAYFVSAKYMHDTCADNNPVSEVVCNAYIKGVVDGAEAGGKRVVCGSPQASLVIQAARSRDGLGSDKANDENADAASAVLKGINAQMPCH